MTMNSPTQYCEVTLTVPRRNADALGSYIIDNITQGLILEEEDDSETTAIRFYVPEEFSTDQQSALRCYLDEIVKPSDDSPSISTRLVKNVEWAERYRESVTAVTVAGDVVIRPPWVEPDETAKYDILIEPKMAFGTGTHETTRSCLGVIRRKFTAGGRFLDLGCGSGILSILADKMGAAGIKAIDNDVIAIDNCKENFAINNVTAEHEVLFGSIEKCRHDLPFDFICANIIKSTVLPMLPDLHSLTASGGLLVLSGLLEADEEETIAALREQKIDSFEIVRDNLWLTFVISRE